MIKRLIVSTLLLFLFPSLIPAPIVPVLEVPQEHYGPVFSYICSALVQQKQSKTPEGQREILGKGMGVYKGGKCTWVAYPDSQKGEELYFLFSVSVDPSELSEMKKKSRWDIFCNSSETFAKYSVPGSTLVDYYGKIPPELEKKARELEVVTAAFGRYLPWTLIQTDFAADKEIAEGTVKIIEKMKIFSELKTELPQSIEVKSSEGPLLDE